MSRLKSVAENCTIAYNENEGLRNASGTITAINSICYFNAGTQISRTAEATYSDVQDGYPGDGNINIHPILGACLQVLPGSLCIDAGNPDPQYNDVLSAAISMGISSSWKSSRPMLMWRN